MPREIVFNEVAVMSKVVDLFWQKGYSGTSMQDLSTVTGLNRSSIYNSFGSKKDLYKLALKAYQKKASSVFQNALLKSNNSKDALEIIFDYLIKSIIEDSDSRGCFIVNCTAEISQKDAAIKQWLAETHERKIGFFESLIEDAQKDGLINKEKTAKEYAQYLYNSFQGLRVTGILVKDKTILKSIVENTFQLLS